MTTGRINQIATVTSPTHADRDPGRVLTFAGRKGPGVETPRPRESCIIILDSNHSRRP